MKKENIEQIVRELFRENFNLYPDSYPLTAHGQMSNEGSEKAQDVAKGYWRERTELDIERDEQAGVTEIDYIEWVMVELSDLITSTQHDHINNPVEIILTDATCKIANALFPGFYKVGDTVKSGHKDDEKVIDAIFEEAHIDDVDM